MIQLTQEEYDKLALAQRRLDCLRAICGYVEDGSDTTITICQDDATRDWFIRIGASINPKSKRFYASSFEGVIDEALKYHYENMDR